MFDRQFLCDGLRKSYDINLTKFKEAVATLGPPPVIGTRSQRDAAVGELTRTRRSRNQLLGALVFHRFATPYRGNHDVHDNLMWRAILSYVRCDRKALHVIGVEAAREAVDPGKTQVDHLRSDSDLVAVPATAHYFPGAWGLAKSRRVPDQVAHPFLEILNGCAHFPAGSKVLIRWNLERALNEPPQFIAAMENWAAMRVIKAGGGHSLDLVVVLMRRGEPVKETPTLRLNKLLNNAVMYSAVCNRWFNLAVQYGILTETLPETLAVNFKQAKTASTDLKGHPEITWDDLPLESKSLISVVAEKKEEEEEEEGESQADVEELERTIQKASEGLSVSSSSSSSTTK